ncbi:hypothetical protein [Bradyrhizobium sp. ORS 111]|uniref:hypothetical protein n=1 Tax=Bradyrhizobium sp. ORS 111 TaxID=1685958 RepID=UPI00388F7F99
MDTSTRNTVPHRGEALIKENYENTFTNRCQLSAQIAAPAFMGCFLLYEEIKNFDA